MRNAGFLKIDLLPFCSFATCYIVFFKTLQLHKVDYIFYFSVCIMSFWLFSTFSTSHTDDTLSDVHNFLS